MRVGIVIGALLAAGCSLVLGPNKDDITPAPDGGIDGGMDGGYDGGDGGEIDDAGDAGFDGGFDAGCVPTQPREVTCNDGIDNDCDLNADCADPNCASDGYCCDPTSFVSSWPGDLVDYTAWVPFNSPNAMSGSVEFATAISQVVHPDCAPLAYGMRFVLDFSRTGARAEDYAAFVLAPVDMPRGGGDMTLLADLALRVTGDGRAVLERAGTIIGMSPAGMELPLGSSNALIDLRPSVDDAGRPVLLVSASVGSFVLVPVAEAAVLMPLDDLIGPDGGCRPDGLHVALEGRGSSIQIGSALTTGIGDCDSPTQFLSDAMGPLGQADVLPPGVGVGEWRAGGAGAPALLAVGSPTSKLELLVDASETERSDEIFRFLDFSIGGSIRTSGWTHRAVGAMSSAQLLGDMPSSREPAFASGAGTTSYLVAFARRRGTGDTHEIAWVTLGTSLSASPSPARMLLEPGRNEGGMEVDCDSLRDPSLVFVPPSMGSDDDLLLFFTCERESQIDTIGVARLHIDTSPTAMNGYLAEALTLDLFEGRSIGDYARQGAFSPEVLVTASEGTTRSLRMWFLTRDRGGRVRVALAYGEVDAGLPRVQPYPGNPVLDAEAQLLGGDCPLGCTIESLGVTATEGEPSLWPPFFGREPSYIFLIERSRFRADGVDHQLVPLRQPRPSDG